MKKIDKSTVFLMALGLFVIIQALRMGTGTFSEPGPGLFPILSGSVLLVFACILFIKSIAAGASGRVRETQGRHMGNVLFVLGSLLFFPLGLSFLGYMVTALITMFGLIKVVGGRRWLPSVAWSVLFTVVSYLLFAKWLIVQFPRGVFPF
jgi:putative tricarboxylic transport membrane protein